MLKIDKILAFRLQVLVVAIKAIGFDLCQAPISSQQHIMLRIKD